MKPLAPPIVTSRLTVRPFAGSDHTDVLAYRSLPEVAQYLYRPPLDRNAVAELIEQSRTAGALHHDGDSHPLAVTLTATGVLVGDVMLRIASVRGRQIEIGWALSPTHTGHGYATEAARALLVRAFELGAHRVFARLDTDNLASVRVCERLGMRREAHLIENDLRTDGAWGSEFVYAALPHDLEGLPDTNQLTAPQS